MALTIAGSDPSGGAGIQADLKTFHQFGVYGEAVVTLVTVQNTVKVERVECLEPGLVTQQLDAVLSDIPPAAAKTGALGDAAITAAVAEAAGSFNFPLVVDPVMVSTHGTPLISEEAREIVKRSLAPRATLITPNLAEAEVLAGFPVTDLQTMKNAAREIYQLGAKAVLVKGGHSRGDATDVLLADGDWHEFPASRIETVHTHGSGCTFSAAITAGLAQGQPLPLAVLRAKRFITAAISTSPGLGRGFGPVNHHAPVEGVR